MMVESENPTTSTIGEGTAHQLLKSHAQQMQAVHMRDMFAQDPTRFDQFNIRVGSIFLDYSKNRITPETVSLLFQLAHETQILRHRTEMFEGLEINETEQRAALHTALRSPLDQEILVHGHNVMKDIADVQNRMRTFTEGIRSGRICGAGGKRITNVVNIGIGGSHLGPQLAVQALTPYTTPSLNIHFISGVDPSLVNDVLSRLHWDQTLFIISSKSFSTLETKMNAMTARQWFLESGGTENDIPHHFIAVSSRPDMAGEFGIAPENVYEMWDWVGGRYSMWSAVGMPIALALGMDGFLELLTGAHDMDRHFVAAPMESNMPIILALLGVWYINYLGVSAHAIVPYTELLEDFPAYLQQLDMESNGKRTSLTGTAISYSTAPIIWGGAGTGVQHSFFQRLHQGVEFVPVDFIAKNVSSGTLDEGNRALLANCFAQSQALMRGKEIHEVRSEMAQNDFSSEDIDFLSPHRSFPGNRPSNTLLLDDLSPRTLGALIALYEHKVAIQGFVWNIDSFDQWGVELGKSLATEIDDALLGHTQGESLDASTAGLIRAVQNRH